MLKQIFFALSFMVAIQLLPTCNAQMLVIGDQDNADSSAVWEHLKSAYDLNDTSLLEINFPDGDQLDRTVWEEEVRPQIAKWLATNDPDHQIIKIVTLYGTPLSVGKWNDDRETGPWLSFYQTALQQQTVQFNKTLNSLAEVVGDQYEDIEGSESLEDYRTAFDTFATKAQSTIGQLALNKQKDAKTQLQAAVQQVAGVGPFINSLRRDMQSGKSEAANQFHYLRGRTEALSGVALLLERVPASFERESFAMSLLQQSGGQLAVIGWIQQQIKMVKDNDSAASLDSELACVLWPEYRRLGTVPNLAHPSFQGSALAARYPTFIVRRLDGPSVEIAKALVDRAVAADTAKIEGNVYLDLRGIQQGDNQTVRFERWLQAIGQQMESVPELKVTVESTPQLFDEGACPDTLLYCGWYSLGKSIDSFTFKPGAVAYHLVPDDASGIHDAADQGWCKYFLEKGATHVLGTVTEAQPVDFEIDGGKLKFHAPVLSSGMIEFGL